jgi:cyclopropane fatty-acyl-phospholipid synthase-like methyltransferase
MDSPSYKEFSKFYDTVMGDRSKDYQVISRLLDTYSRDGQSLLEVACGTGEILLPFSKKYEVAGLDASGPMLWQAKQKLPGVRFYRSDMRKFTIPRVFDIVICVFDSVNHLLKFSEWKSLFNQVRRHLSADGIFLFDINTRERLTSLAQSPAWVKDFDNNTMIMKVSQTPKGLTEWHIRVFEYQRRGQYRVTEERIREISFDIKLIKEALHKNFKKVHILNEDGTNFRQVGGRAFCIGQTPLFR